MVSLSARKRSRMSTHRARKLHVAGRDVHSSPAPTRAREWRRPVADLVEPELVLQDRPEALLLAGRAREVPGPTARDLGGTRDAGCSQRVRPEQFVRP